ncbi:MAG: hypothetical protein FWH40_03030 [Coriobacteriia bacterium]|nr:hypothetical protein [Coriobacteriia bacterium]
MQSVILLMQEQMEAQSLMAELRYFSNIRAASVVDYEKFSNTYRYTNADIVMMEISEDNEYGIGFCLQLASQMRARKPECKVVLLCSGFNEEAEKAKSEGLVKEIVYREIELKDLAAAIIQS